MQGIFRNEHGAVRNGWKVAGFFVLSVIMVMVLMGLYVLVATESDGDYMLPEAWVTFGAVLLATLACVMAEGRTMASIGFALDRRALRLFGQGLAIGAALVLATLLLVWLLGGVHLERADIVNPAAIIGTGLTMLGAVLFEEALFRGYGLRRTADGLGRGWALAVFALIFVVAHPMDRAMSQAAVLNAAANLMFASLLLGACYLKSGSIALPAGLHLGWNWTTQLLGFSITGSHEGDSLWRPVFDSSNEWLTGGDYGLTASAVSLPLLAIATWWALRTATAVESRP